MILAEELTAELRRYCAAFASESSNSSIAENCTQLQIAAAHNSYVQSTADSVAIARSTL
jgi:hypothetical protein